MKKHPQKRVKQCYRCLRGNLPGSRKCAYCGFKFVSSRRHSLVDKIKQILQIDDVYKVLKGTSENGAFFFSSQELERLVKMDKITILMFLTLDNIDFLDEQTLIDLGNILSSKQQ